MVDLAHLYRPFLELVPSGGRILDAGCGPGRDSKRFLDRGYDVVSFDAADRMVELATARTGRRALLLRFQDINFSHEFDGIWACASLLHVPFTDLALVFSRMMIAMNRGACSTRPSSTEPLRGRRRG